MIACRLSSDSVGQALSRRAKSVSFSVSGASWGASDCRLSREVLACKELGSAAVGFISRVSLVRSQPPLVPKRGPDPTGARACWI
jgi:hypothetical protein